MARDIEKAITHLEALGFGPFKFDDETKVLTIAFKGELHGQPAEWKTKVSNGKMGDVELELLEPCERQGASLDPAAGPGRKRESMTTPSTAASRQPM
jgi:hypothetical protein